MKNHIVNVPLTQEKEEQSKDVHRAALQHWFAKEKPARRETRPVIYEKPAPTENNPCPPGIDQLYWQNLSKIEQIWTTSPVQAPTLEQRRQLWQQMSEIQTHKDTTTNQSDYFSQALRPADPFEEPIARKSRLLRSKVETNVVGFKPTELVWKLACNE
jgi:hypothetical protein